jgi:hypothetical protein
LVFGGLTRIARIAGLALPDGNACRAAILISYHHISRLLLCRLTVIF